MAQAPEYAAVSQRGDRGCVRASVSMEHRVGTEYVESLGEVSEQHARPARAAMLEELTLPPPLVAAAPAAKPKPKPSEEGTYAELVGEAGY